MRLVLFEMAGLRAAVCMAEVLHVLPAPTIWPLPRLRPDFGGVFLYQGQVVPLLDVAGATAQSDLGGQFVIVCKADFGLIGLPAEKIERITAPTEYGENRCLGHEASDKPIEINGLTYNLYNLNHLLEATAA